jgi:hypothetical protein
MDQPINESDARKEQLAAEAFQRIRTGQHWSDWMFIADGLLVGRNWAMRRAGMNQPVGRAYNTEFGDWMAERPWARDLDKKDRGDLFWCADHRSEIEAWRETLAQNVRGRLNHPTALRRRYEATHRSEAAEAAKPPKPSGTAALEIEIERMSKELAARDQEIEFLKAAPQTDGSLFDLIKTPAKTIAKIILQNAKPARAKAIRDALTQAISKAEERFREKAKQAG